MSRSKELFILMRDEEVQREAEIQEHFYFNQSNINPLNFQTK